jgi:hypothetical protein
MSKTSANSIGEAAAAPGSLPYSIPRSICTESKEAGLRRESGQAHAVCEIFEVECAVAFDEVP